MNSTTSFVFRPRFPWISLVLGAWLVSRGMMFFGVLLLFMAAMKAWRWYRGPIAVPRAYFHLRRGGFAGGFGQQQPPGGPEPLRQAPPDRGNDESRVEAAEWRQASIES